MTRRIKTKYERFQVSAAKQMRTELFWVITQCADVIPYLATKGIITTRSVIAHNSAVF